MATPSKIPLPPMEGKKGRLRPSLLSDCSRLYAANGVELLTQTVIPSLTHLGITGGPELPFLLYHPPVPQRLIAFLTSTLLRGFPLPLSFNDTALINSVNGSSTLQARLSPPPLLPKLSPPEVEGAPRGPSRAAWRGRTPPLCSLFLGVFTTSSHPCVPFCSFINLQNSKSCKTSSNQSVQT